MLNSFSALAISLNISSIISLVVPYGLVVPPVLQSSVRGILSGVPYTVADELNTNFFTLYFLIVSNNIKHPVTLLW